MQYSVFINENSGGIKKLGKTGLRQSLKSIFGDRLKELRFLSPAGIKQALKKFDGTSALLVGGGDGTLATAALLLRERNIPFGILPLGTMNLFARDVDLPVDPMEAAKLYADLGCEPVSVDIGRVNDYIFLCNAMIGVASDLALQRESRRRERSFLKWLSLSREMIRRLSGDRYYPLSIRCNGDEEIKLIKAAVISNNLYEGGQGAANRFRKKSLSEGLLGIYIVTPEGTLQSLNLLASMALGSWQHDHSIEVRESCALELSTIRQHAVVLLDGEVHRIRGPLRFRSDPKSLPLLLPMRMEGA